MNIDTNERHVNLGLHLLWAGARTQVLFKVSSYSDSCLESMESSNRLGALHMFAGLVGSLGSSDQDGRVLVVRCNSIYAILSSCVIVFDIVFWFPALLQCSCLLIDPLRSHTVCRFECGRRGTICTQSWMVHA